MGPREAGYAIARYLKGVKVVIPMHFGTFPLLKGTVEEFQAHLETFTPEFKRDPVRVIDPNVMLAEAIDLP